MRTITLPEYPELQRPAELWAESCGPFNRPPRETHPESDPETRGGWAQWLIEFLERLIVELPEYPGLPFARPPDPDDVMASIAPWFLEDAIKIIDRYARRWRLDAKVTIDGEPTTKAERIKRIFRLIIELLRNGDAIVDSSIWTALSQARRDIEQSAFPMWSVDSPEIALAAASSVEGYRSAQWLEANHGIGKTRLSEAARNKLVRKMKAPQGYTDCEGYKPRLLYEEASAIQHCSPQRLGRKKGKRTKRVTS